LNNTLSVCVTCLDQLDDGKVKFYKHGTLLEEHYKFMLMDIFVFVGASRLYEGKGELSSQIHEK